MSDFLDAGKEIVFTRHLTEQWADRIAAARGVAQAGREKEIIERISSVLKARKYKLVHDGEEFNGKKYRMVCELFGMTATFVVIDAKQALVFKSVWKAKDWEEKYLKEVK